MSTKRRQATTLEKIIEQYDEVVFKTMTGFDSAVIGVEDRTMRLIYS